MITKRDLRCPMRDGVTLSTDVYLPGEDGAFPLILMRTPYGRQGIETDPLYGYIPQLIEAGYAVASQDLRGTGDSGGQLGLNGQNEHFDGYDAVEWLAVQPFCNGQVGMFGLSYPGFVQTAAAAYAPPHLKAVCPFMAPSQNPFGVRKGHVRHMVHLFWSYAQTLQHPDKYIPDAAKREEILAQMRANMPKLPGMIAQLPLDACPAAMVEGVPILQDYLDVMYGAEDPAYWAKMHMPIDFDQVHVPALFGTGWFDGACEWTLNSYFAARKSADPYTREHAHLLIGPWPHGGELPQVIEGYDQGEEASGKSQQVQELMQRWFDVYLKGEDKELLPQRVRYFITGENTWRDAADWPPPEAELTPFYLAEGSILAGAAAQTQTIAAFDADPMNPTPSSIRDENGHSMLADWQQESRRDDVLFFQTQPLENPVTVAGLVKARINAITDAPDTDFACRLVDIAPDGAQRLLTCGLVRGRYRAGLFEKTNLEPGAVNLFSWDVGSCAHTFQPGHRIGVHVCSFLYPDFERNMNTGSDTASGTDWAVAHQQVLLGGATPSLVELPMIACGEKE